MTILPRSLSKKRFYFVLIGVCILMSMLYIYKGYESSLENDIRKSDFHQTNSIQREPLALGAQMVFGFGTPTESPYLETPYQTPKPKFYVVVAEPDRHCVADICGIEGSIIKTIGGWAQIYNTKFAGTRDFFEFDKPKNKDIKTMVIISDENGKIAGIYPNKKFNDVIGILKFHPKLADFGLIKGVKEFGMLKVGESAPLKPGDKISHLSKSLDAFAAYFSYIPRNKKFYLYALQNKNFDEYSYLCFLADCQYPEFAPDHWFLPGLVDYLNGWFLANDMENGDLIKLFGLDPNDVLSGKSSLVVLTDAKGVIVALHPHKTLSDALTILSQHPDLADIYKLYQ